MTARAFENELTGIGRAEVVGPDDAGGKDDHGVQALSCRIKYEQGGFGLGLGVGGADA